MYSLARFAHTPVVRRQAAYFQATEDFFRPLFEMMNSPLRTNVRETEEAYLFEAELPGFELDEIDLSVQDGMLAIAAEHKEGGEDTSFSSRSVRRSFTMEGVDEGNISAEYKNGVLRVTLPKEKAPEAPAPRKIEIT